jgi:hypothetical protein
MGNHTPGPWVVEPGKPLMVVAEKGGFAVLISECVKKITPTDKANASLIAAAPDLLALVKEIRKWMDGEVMGAWDAKFIDEIDAAIARAEGRAEEAAYHYSEAERES